jgi:hypothetical protein
MSNALAIAAVTEALVQTLQQALTGINLGSGAQVTNTRPDQENGVPALGVNVFLYQVTPNPSLRNSDLPTRAADGTLLRRPRAALDLHYLLTFYGDDATLEQQRLLGAVVRELHANPTLPRTMITHVEQSVSFLAGSDLDQQPELVRFTPINFTLEELSKLWSFLLKTDYVLSVAYVASVVMIETDDVTPAPALPVLSPAVTVLPFRQPLVASIQPALASAAFILAGSQIVIAGENFILDPASGASSVLIGGQMQTPASITDTQIVVALPSGLAAGAQTVQIVQSLMLGVPPVAHQLGFQSDLATFVLHPQINRSNGGYEILAGPGAGSPPGTSVIATLTPPVRAGQRAILELLSPAQPDVARLFDGGVATADTDTVSFPIAGLPSGSYLARIRVDGAQSPFDVDPSGTPIAPVINL